MAIFFFLPYTNRDTAVAHVFNHVRCVCLYACVYVYICKAATSHLLWYIASPLALCPVQPVQARHWEQRKREQTRVWSAHSWCTE